jgi:heme-degrading monooxygenase HmoA
MTFKEGSTRTFLDFFHSRKQQIMNFPGCHHLELWQDKQHPNVYFTYSHWENEEALDHYRYSAFFKETWAITKQYFSAKAEAYSIHRVTVE